MCRPLRVSVAIAGLALSVSAVPAGAESLFDLLFGATAASTGEQTSAPPPVEAIRRPMSLTVRPRVAVSAFGRGTAYCVRLCDGRYFPIQRATSLQSAQICNSLCPASKTRVFAGPDISRAIAADGTNYAALKTAFRYRDETVEDCTCNGVTAYGLAAMDARDDPTLRAGDLVATPAGLVRSVALPKAAQKTRDDEIATSALPLGLRGQVSEAEPVQLRGTSQAAAEVAKPVARLHAKRFHDMFAERKRARQAR
jgi:hypothetical protein